MDNRNAIIQATISLINEKGENVNNITMREICKKANVGLGLINYHIENKDNLISTCVEKIVNNIVAKFVEMSEKAKECTPFEKLERLGNMTLTFLFEHYAISRISILSDIQSPNENDNTHRTYRAYLPLVASCRPDWDKNKVAEITYCLIITMQQSFLRHEVIRKTQNINLKNNEERKRFYKKMIENLIGEADESISH